MKKLNLNVANLGATEILTREELKKVLGGTGSGSGSGSSAENCLSLPAKAFCGEKRGTKCTTSDGATGKCGVRQAETQCRCIVT